MTWKKNHVIAAVMDNPDVPMRWSRRRNILGVCIDGIWLYAQISIDDPIRYLLESEVLEEEWLEL